jgi:hypothetical protein
VKVTDPVPDSVDPLFDFKAISEIVKRSERCIREDLKRPGCPLKGAVKVGGKYVCRRPLVERYRDWLLDQGKRAAS